MAAFTPATTSSNVLEVVRLNRSTSILLIIPTPFPAFAVAKTPSCPIARQLSQLAIEKGVRPFVGERRSLGVVMRPTMSREGMILTRIVVDGRVRFAGKRRFDLGLRSLGNELVFLGQMHQQRRSKP